MLQAIKSVISWFLCLFDREPLGAPTTKEWALLRQRALSLAERMGKNELPLSTDSELSEAEQDIVYFVDKEKGEIERTFDIELKSTRTNLAMFAPDFLNAELKSQAQDAVVRFDASMSSHLAEVFPLENVYIGRKRERNDFRNKYKINWESKHPDSIILHIGVLFAILLIEMLSNAFFFMEAAPLGLVGGFVQAFFLALIGISLAWVNAKCIQQVFHRLLVIKIPFTIISVIAFASLICYVAMIGHLRDFQIANPTIAINDLSPMYFADKISQSAFLYASIDSYLTTTIMLIFSIISVIDILRMDDLFPGYGKRSRKYDRAFEDLRESRELQREKLTICQRESKNEIRVLNRILESKFIQHNSIIGMYHDKERRYIDALENLKARSSALLADFRKINLKFRQSPPPSYFLTHTIDWDRFNLHGIKAFLTDEKMQELLDSSTKIRQEADAEIYKKFKLALERLDKGTDVSF